MARRAGSRKVRVLPIALRSTRLVASSGPRYFVAMLASEIVNAIALAGVLFFGREVVARLTDAANSGGTSEIVRPVVGLGVAMLVTAVVQVASSESRSLLASYTARRVEEEIVDIATSVDYQEYEDPAFFDLFQRANTSAGSSTFQMVSGIVGVVSTIATTITVVLVLVATVPSVLPVLVLVAVPFAVAARTSARLAFRMTYELTTNDRLTNYLYNALTAQTVAKELRIFGLAEQLRRRWRVLYSERLRRARRLAGQRLLLNGGAALASTAMVAGVLIVLSRAAASGDIEVADAAVAIVALQQLSTRIRSVTNAMGGLRSAALFLDDFEEFGRRRGGEDFDADVDPLPHSILRVDDVSFRYPGTERTVLHHVNLEIRPGQIVALVGVSGSGKTTLAHLVAGLYRPTSGSITYGGRDIGDLERSRYHRSLSVVFQDYVRYAMTARENIALGEITREGDDGAVFTAARRASVADELAALPAGYETLLNRGYLGGVDLSVGQWQRVAVARALFRDAPLLVLDEPAAALDAIAEQQLFETLKELVVGRSVLMISHRFSTARLADAILVMRDGRIVESGTHEELLRLNGTYAELFAIQAKGYCGIL